MNRSMPYKLSTTSDKFTARSGLVLVAGVLRRIGLDTRVGRCFPAPGSRRGFTA